MLLWTGGAREVNYPQATSTHLIMCLHQISITLRGKARALTPNTQMPCTMQPDPAHLEQPLQASPEPDVAPLAQRPLHLFRAEPVPDRLQVKIPPQAVVISVHVLSRPEMQREVPERTVGNTATAGAVRNTERFERLVLAGHIRACTRFLCQLHPAAAKQSHTVTPEPVHGIKQW